MKETKQKTKHEEKMERESLQVEKVDIISGVMGMAIIDDERNVLGSEPVYKCAFDEVDRGIIKEKIMQIIKEL